MCCPPEKSFVAPLDLSTSLVSELKRIYQMCFSRRVKMLFLVEFYWVYGFVSGNLHVLADLSSFARKWLFLMSSPLPASSARASPYRPGPLRHCWRGLYPTCCGFSVLMHCPCSAASAFSTPWGKFWYWSCSSAPPSEVVLLPAVVSALYPIKWGWGPH